MPYKKHLTSAADLVTPRAVTAQGFISMSLERSRRATVYVKEGKVLRSEVGAIADASSLIGHPTLQEALLTAAGVSDKAKDYFDSSDKETAIKEFTETFLIPAGTEFSDELVSRYLLTRGDTLGGAMRNVVGYLAGVKLITNLIAALNVLGMPYQYQDRNSGKWLIPSPLEPEIERQASALSWNVGGEPRTLLQNLNVPKVNKNVDLCLFACSPGELSTPTAKKRILADPSKYIALGELKGGIDPAGADEHWKTARSALQRIREVEVFQDKKLFFVGAAIVTAMSAEIWADLESGKLANAANLTNDAHSASIASWLITL